MEYKIGDIFYEDEDYANKADFCNEHNLIIEEIEPDDKGRRFQIKEFIKTEEMILMELRSLRQLECFSIINRGTLWYATLTEIQKQELQNWYQEWLDVTETRVVPEKPNWLH